MCGFLVGYAPLLASDATELGAPVHLGLVEGVFLLHTGLTDAVAVADAQLDGVGALLGVLIANLVEA